MIEFKSSDCNKNYMMVLKYIYDNSYMTDIDFIGYTSFPLEYIQSIISTLHKQNLVLTFEEENQKTYYLSKEGCFNYIVNSNPLYVNGLYEKIRKSDLSTDFAVSFLKDKFYDMYKYKQDVNVDRLVEDYSEFIKKSNEKLILEKNARF